MDDLISRQAAIDVLDAYQVMVENGEENPYAWARLRMCELPSEQQKIIRCNDCKWFDKTSPSGTVEPIGFRCKLKQLFVDADDFCKRGERREE